MDNNEGKVATDRTVSGGAELCGDRGHKREIFSIESVLCGDGSTKNSIHLKKGGIYASECLDGGREYLHLIHFETLPLATRDSLRGGNWKAHSITKAKAAFKPTPKVIILVQFRKHLAYKNELKRTAALEWCNENPGVALIVGSP